MPFEWPLFLVAQHRLLKSTTVTSLPVVMPTGQLVYFLMVLSTPGTAAALNVQLVMRT